MISKILFFLSKVDCVQRKMDENQAEYSSRVLESGQLLDIRADRIRKLEKYIFKILSYIISSFPLFRALKDVAYGTRQYRVQEQPTGDGHITNELIEDAIELERGQNLIEIHISRASFNDEMNLIDYLTEHYREMNIRLHLVTDRSPEGQQFRLGFGGCIALLRYTISTTIFDSIHNDSNEIDDYDY